MLRVIEILFYVNFQEKIVDNILFIYFIIYFLNICLDTKSSYKCKHKIHNTIQVRVRKKIVNG